MSKVLFYKHKINNVIFYIQEKDFDKMNLSKEMKKYKIEFSSEKEFNQYIKENFSVIKLNKKEQDYLQENNEIMKKIISSKEMSLKDYSNLFKTNNKNDHLLLNQLLFQKTSRVEMTLNFISRDKIIEQKCLDSNECSIFLWSYNSWYLLPKK